MIFRHLLNMRSHPTWVRGLKLLMKLIEVCPSLSHPTWVRGLKPLHPVGVTLDNESHPTWVRGLKQSLAKTCANFLGRTLRGCVD